MEPPTNPKTISPPANPELPAAPGESEQGCYLYGITSSEVASQVAANLTADGGEPLVIVEQDKLAAVTRTVLRAEFSSEALQARAQDLAWLESMVREHNRVIEQMHQRGPVLPGKFGAVYPNSEALQNALAEARDVLLAQLGRLQNSDEWGIHLYADRQAVQRLAGEHPALQQLQNDLAAASPGRAYLLKRKLADAMTDITEEALSALALASYNRLAAHAVAGQISPRPPQPADSASEREALRAAFLVQRGARDDFLQEIERLVQAQDGLRCEYSGPWPPYSFASIDGEDRS